MSCPQTPSYPLYLPLFWTRFSISRKLEPSPSSCVYTCVLIFSSTAYHEINNLHRTMFSLVTPYPVNMVRRPSFVVKLFPKINSVLSVYSRVTECILFIIFSFKTFTYLPTSPPTHPYISLPTSLPLTF